MHPGAHAATDPNKPAIILEPSGEVISYQQLDERSNQLAHLLRSFGLRRGDAIALCMENNGRFHEICWGAQRSGLYYTAASSRLTPGELAYIVEDCGAKVLILSHAKKDLAAALSSGLPNVQRRLMVGGTIEGWESYEDAVAGQPTTPIPDESEGADMLYSSGTTGRPKGVRVPLPEGEFGSNAGGVGTLAQFLYGFTADSRYLSPAPLYHAAPLRYTMACHRIGATVVVMESFDPVACLALIQEHRITHGQFVPTMFIRMLKLDEAERKAYDVSSITCAIHAAAPCPIPIKEQMIEWWGPVIYEYYAGTEGNGFCAITSEEWLQHKGSVGKNLLGQIHIVGDDGEELPPGEAGTIFFEGGARFEYHNDPEKTKGSYNDKGWSTLGDIGYVDPEGYLYLTDRKANMIISGGVNIYPQEAENVLTMHPKVADVAVFGVPNEDFGEEVKAVVQPVSMAEAGPELEQELLEFVRSQLSPIKCPRSIDFREELPRHPTGKLYKRLLRDEYWKGQTLTGN
jgi:acyl-CoA synthetase (AMP-forming)/AMP-acid ligase II